MNHELTQHAGRTNVSQETALTMFDACPKELRPVDPLWKKPDAQCLHIFHDGRWKLVCRVDDKDNVSTFSWEPECNTAEYYRDRLRLGARFDDKSFCCIDSHSDGQLVVTCYAQPDKPKSRQVLEAFAAGCGGRMASTAARELEPGPAAFYGVRPGWRHLWEQAKAEGRDWYYLDNSYFDCARGRQFRVTKNAIQHTGLGNSDGRRFAALGIPIKRMRKAGLKVVIAAQSPEFMACVAGDPGWLERETRSLRWHYGEANVIVRTKQEKRPLLEDLKDAGLLVTWSSAAAVTALLEGLKVLTASECCATGAGADLERWAGVLADNQWTISELKDGTAWRALNR